MHRFAGGGARRGATRGRRTCGCIKRGEATPVTRGGSMPSIRFHRAIGNLLLFLLSTAASCLSLAVSLGLMHITPRALTFAICSHARMRPPSGLRPPPYDAGRADDTSRRRRHALVPAPEDNRSSAPCTTQRKEKGMRAASSERAPLALTSFDPAAKDSRAPPVIQSDSYPFNEIARGALLHLTNFPVAFYARCNSNRSLHQVFINL